MPALDLTLIVQVTQAISLILSVLWSAVKIVHKITSLEESFNELSIYVKETLDLKLDDIEKRLAKVEAASAVENDNVKPSRRRRA